MFVNEVLLGCSASTHTLLTAAFAHNNGIEELQPKLDGLQVPDIT